MEETWVNQRWQGRRPDTRRIGPLSTTAQNTAGINRSNTAVRAVLKQPCSTGVRTGTVRPKNLPPDQPGPVGQICPTSWLLLSGRTVPVQPPVNTAV
ncbi:hypothetical protein PCASD_07471 [Puccinia coronata f. sp. avenae]|uniref:Uncharacterized protein n=1 Tax=Puccinia coronata f. sp. avenae TaxID=200324 RepID=A0A2N5TG57_9BASI|nr:hypothetical protein PCASD_07471 [Puccinia coronata f. sp. avenae]